MCLATVRKCLPTWSKCSNGGFLHLLMFTRYTRWLLTIVLFYAVNTIRWSDEKPVMTLRRSTRPILSLGFKIIYTVVGIMDKMSQSNYMILHADLIIKLERIEAALWMRLGSTQKNVHKLVLPRQWYFCSRWARHIYH